MESGQDRATIYAALALAIVVFVTFGGSLGNEFVYDDHQIVEKNPVVRTLAPLSHLSLAYWSKFESDYEYYRPATSWSLALDHAIHGEGPRGFHLTNLLLHLANALLVFRLVRRFGGLLVGSVAAGLFAVHPVQTEAVVWISARTDLLATFFLLLALEIHAFLPERYGGRAVPLYAGQVLVVSAALLSKEAAITFPALLLGVEVAGGLARGETVREMAGRIGRKFLVLGPVYLVLIGGYLYLRFMVVGQLAGGLESGEELWKNPLLTASLGERLLTAVNIAGRYLWLLVFPAALSVDYYFNVVPLVSSAISGAFLIPLVALAVLGWPAVALARREPAACFGLLAGGGAYALVSQVLIAAPIVMAERALYLPMIGIAALLSAGVVALIGRLAGPDRLRNVTIVVAVPLLLAMGVRAHQRTADFRNERSLFEATTRATPTSSVGWNNLGAAQIAQGEMDGALASFSRAAEIAPEHLRAHLNQARATMRLGDVDGGERLLRVMLVDFPDDHEAIWIELAQLLSRRADSMSSAGSAEAARGLREEALARAESFGASSKVPDIKASFLLLAAQNSMALNRRGQAGRIFGEAVRHVDPPVSPQIRLTVLEASAGFLYRTGELGQAANHWDLAAATAERLNQATKAAELLLRSGEAHRKSGSTEEARTRFRRAEQLAAGDPRLQSLARTALSNL